MTNDLRIDAFLETAELARDAGEFFKIAFPFFLGYSVHLFADSFTVDGIRFFWPFKARSAGLLKVGGATEHALFVGFCVVDLIMVFSLFL